MYILISALSKKVSDASTDGVLAIHEWDEVLYSTLSLVRPPAPSPYGMFGPFLGYQGSQCSLPAALLMEVRIFPFFFSFSQGKCSHMLPKR